MSRCVQLICAAGGILFLASCGSDRPDPQLAVARSALDSAQRLSAAQYAPVPYQTARSKLDAAEQAVQKGDNDKARRLAVEASADAHLAEVTAQAAAADQNLAQIQAGTSGSAVPVQPAPLPLSR